LDEAMKLREKVLEKRLEEFMIHFSCMKKLLKQAKEF
jgi:hypothetical protein